MKGEAFDCTICLGGRTVECWMLKKRTDGGENWQGVIGWPVKVSHSQSLTTRDCLYR